MESSEGTYNREVVFEASEQDVLVFDDYFLGTALNFCAEFRNSYVVLFQLNWEEQNHEHNLNWIIVVHRVTEVKALEVGDRSWEYSTRVVEPRKRLFNFINAKAE